MHGTPTVVTTARLALPGQPPEALGYPGVEDAPTTLVGQLLHPAPVAKWWQRLRDRRAQRDQAGSDPSDPGAD